MLEFLAEYGLFLAKAVTVVAAILVVVAGIVAASQRMRPGPEGHIEVRKLNERLDAMRNTLRAASLPPKELKRLLKGEQKAAQQKQRAREKGAAAEAARRIFVLSF